MILVLAERRFPDIGITDEMKRWSQLVLELFRSLLVPAESDNVSERIADVKRKLSDITTLIHAVSKKPDSTEAIADSIESELLGMDKAIEEAAARIEVLYSILCSLVVLSTEYLFTGHAVQIESIRFGY